MTDGTLTGAKQLAGKIYNPKYIENPYTLPIATATVLGGVKIGGNVTEDNDGKISITAANVTGALGYTPPRQDTTYDDANATTHGLMTAGDFTKLSGIASGAQVNKVEIIEVNGTALVITNKAANIDLSGYATKSDINSALTSYYTKTEVDTLLSAKSGLDVTKTITLAAATWSSATYTITDTDIKADSTVILSLPSTATADMYDAWAHAKVVGSNTVGSMVLTALGDVPTIAINLQYTIGGASV